MRYIIFVISAYFTGALAAVPAGPVQLEVVRRSINGHIRSALMVVLGALIVDIFYGLIAFFGIAPYLKEEKIMALFWLAGSAILTVLGIMVIRNSSGKTPMKHAPGYLGKKRKLIDRLTPDLAVSFLVAGGSGLASYLIFLSIFLYWAKKFLSEVRIRKINLLFGYVLLIIASYFVFSSLSYLMKSS
jgi:threonine/homoserine/homoserine lactone efflux protein